MIGKQAELNVSSNTVTNSHALSASIEIVPCERFGNQGLSVVAITELGQWPLALAPVQMIEWGMVNNRFQ